MSTQKLAAGLCLAMMIPACGGGGSSATPVTTTTTVPCTQTILFEGGGPAPANTLFPAVPFNFTSTGRLDVILDWTSPTSPIGVYVVPINTCTLDQFNARTCNFVIRSEPSSVKPRKSSASGVAAGNYLLLIANFGAQDESASTQIIFSSATCPPLSIGGSSQASEPPVASMGKVGWSSGRSAPGKE